MSLGSTVISDDLPVLAGDEARRIDKEVSEILGRVRILETVALRISDAIDHHLVPDRKTPLLFVAGKGNNGANAIAAARILAMRGRDATVLPLVDVSNDDLRPNIREQIDLFRGFGGEDRILHDPPPSYDSIFEGFRGVVVDGILGTGISSPPRGASRDAIVAINNSSSSSSCKSSSRSGEGVRVLSIDVPSGLNHITGEAPGECVRATWTLNLHMLKSGQLEPGAGEYVGELWSAESGLGYGTFPGLSEKFSEFYGQGPIRKV